MQHEEPQTAIEDAVAKVEAAINTGRWLVFAAKVEDGKVVVDKVSWAFPKEDLATAMELAKKLVNEELPVTPLAPLPRFNPRKNEHEMVSDPGAATSGSCTGQNGTADLKGGRSLERENGSAHYEDQGTDSVG